MAKKVINPSEEPDTFDSLGMTEEEKEKAVSETEKRFLNTPINGSKEKRIELVRMKISDLNFKFENPRKIKKKKAEELKKSLEQYGDFGVIVIDENNSVLSGNQRLSQMIALGIEEVDCKRLIGYSEVEKKSINIKANTHAGEWDMGMLAQWTADIGMEVVPESIAVEERTINEMELVRFEKYDYVIIACKTDMEYNLLTEKLGIQGKYVKLNNSRKIEARAVWFDKVFNLFK